jgi:hypothetical protein
MTNASISDRSQAGAREANDRIEQIESLGDFIESRFPAEAASIDMTDRAAIIRLATDLLERLWRWEH